MQGVVILNNIFLLFEVYLSDLFYLVAGHFAEVVLDL